MHKFPQQGSRDLNRRAGLSLSHQLALACGGLSLLVAMVLVLIGSLSSRYILEQQEDAHGDLLGKQVAREIAPTMATGDLIRLEVTLRQLHSRHSLRQISVFDVEGAALGSVGSNGEPDSREYRATVTIGSDTAGEVSLVLAPDPALLEQRRMTLGLMFLALLLSLFIAALALRWGQKFAGRLRAVNDLLQLDAALQQDHPQGDELLQLEAAVQELPLELLRSPGSSSTEHREYREAGLLYLRLDSLSSYVETLDESSLLRYTELQRRIVHDSAQLYGGKLSVARQFGLLVSFAGDHPAGSPAFRAVSAAWLIHQVIQALQNEKKLRHTLTQAVGISESGTGSSQDIYPDLYNQHIIDELAGRVDAHPAAILLSQAAAGDLDIVSRCRCDGSGEQRLSGFEEPYSDLLERQRELLLRKLPGGD